MSALARHGASLLALVAVSLGGAARAEVLVPELPRRAVPSAEAETEARKAYEKAAGLLEKGKLGPALESAKLAYAMLPNASTAALYCIALGQQGQHREAFERCLVGLALGPTAEEKRLIEEYLGQYGRAAGLGWAAVQVDPATAEVEVEGARFEGSRPIGLTPGEHELRVSAKGHLRRTLTASVAAGAGSPLLVALSIDVSTPDPIGPKPAAPKTGKPSYVGRGALGDAGLGLMIGGGVVALAGIPVTAWSLGRSSDSEAPAAVLRKDRETPGSVEASALQSAQSAYNKATDDIATGNLVSGLLYGLGGAALATGIVLFLVDGGERRPPGSAATLRWVPAVGRGEAGFVLGGSF